MYTSSYYYTTTTNGLLSSPNSIEVNDKGGFLTIPLPGYSKGDVSVVTAHNLIKVSAEKQGKAKFTNSFLVDDQLDLQKASASMKDGELKIEIPYKPSTKPRNIQIQ